MPEITVPRKTAVPGSDLGPQIPIDLGSDQFAAQRAGAKLLGDVGQIGVDSAVNTIRAQGAEEFTSAKLDYETEFRKFQAELLTDTDYSSYSEKFNAWHDGFTNERIKGVNHKGASGRTAEEFDYQRAVRGRTIDSDAQTKLVRETRRTLPDKIEVFVSEELGAETPAEIDKANNERAEYFQTLIETGVLNEAEAAGLEMQYQTAKGERVLQNTVTGIAVEEGWDEALEWLDDPGNIKNLLDEFGIEVEELTPLTNAVKARAERSRSDGIVTLSRQREADGDEFVKRLDGLVRGTAEADTFNELIDDVLGSSLTPTGQNSKQSWIDKINSQSKAINDGREDPFNQTDNAVYFDLRTRIEDDDAENPVTIDELREKVGKGLATAEKPGGISLTAYNTLFGMVTDADNPLNKPQAKRAQQVFSRLRQLALDAFKTGDLPEGQEDLTPGQIELNFLAIQDEFDGWLTDDPDATDAQIQEKVRVLTRPVAEAVTLNFFEKLIKPKRGFLKGVRPEAEALAAKKLKALKKEPVWDTLSDTEKKEAKQAFDNGFTLDDVLIELGQ